MDDERKLPHSDWWFRDLPHIDWEEEDGEVGTEFDMLRSSDDDYEWRQIEGLYTDASLTEKQAINQVFIHLCGWSLPTILEKAKERIRCNLPPKEG